MDREHRESWAPAILSAEHESELRKRGLRIARLAKYRLLSKDQQLFSVDEALTIARATHEQTHSLDDTIASFHKEVRNCLRRAITRVVNEREQVRAHDPADAVWRRDPQRELESKESLERLSEHIRQKRSRSHYEQVIEAAFNDEKLSDRAQGLGIPPNTLHKKAQKLRDLKATILGEDR